MEVRCALIGAVHPTQRSSAPPPPHSLYHHENPFFGHWGVDKTSGQLVGVWLTPLGGATNATSAATYGVGPQHQDLAIHQNGLILNYMSANHYGLPAYPVAQGYTRFYGPYLHHATLGSPSDVSAFFAAASAVAASNIAASHTRLPFIDHSWYPVERANVTGTVVVADGRPGSGIWASLSTQNVEVEFTIHEPTWFVLTGQGGAFSIPGVPPGQYFLYLTAASGSITDARSPQRVTVGSSDSVVALGTVAWAPPDGSWAFVFQLGAADRSGGEFALAREPRAWELPGRVPGDVNFTVGSSWEPHDWYYAQTQGGTWTIVFSVPAAFAPGAVAQLTISASLTDGDSPTVSVNGDASGIAGAVPSGIDSTLSRQAVRSGFPRLGTLSFDASRLRVGVNRIAFTRAAARGTNNTGMGWDTVKLQVSGGPAPLPAALRVVSVTQLFSSPQVFDNNTCTLRCAVVNEGAGHAMDARLEALTLTSFSAPLVFADGRDPARFPLPLGNVVAKGGMAFVDVFVSAESGCAMRESSAASYTHVRVSANGGRTRVEAVLVVESSLSP